MNHDVYIRVNWPEVQSLMNEPWFRHEAILDNRENAPSSSYLIPKDILDCLANEGNDHIIDENTNLL